MQVEFTGLTGEVRFDDHGRRDYFKLDLIEKRRVNMVKTGIWYPDSGVNYTVSVEEQDEMVQLALQNMTLRVVTVVVCTSQKFRGLATMILVSFLIVILGQKTANFFKNSQILFPMKPKVISEECFSIDIVFFLNRTLHM